VALDTAPGSRRRLPALLRRGARRLRRRTMPSQAVLLLWLTGLTVVVAVGARLQPTWVPASSMVLVLILGGFFLRLRSMLVLYVVAFAGFVFAATSEDRGPTLVTPGVVLLVLTIAVLVALWVRSRERLGLQGTSGDTMLVDLRDRLRSHGQVPPLPPGWGMEVELRPAFGDSFSGDFVVATTTGHGPATALEVVLVDVSGKGQHAGSRSLLLSGALGGLLGSVPAEDFLSLANDYLLRQDWPEGFATAVHARVDLATGAYRVASAGHPPAASGQGGQPWQLLDDDHGPALGLVPWADFPAVHGMLAPGQAMVLYTDGLVEAPGEDLAEGIDALVAQASAAGAGGWAEGAAARVVDAVRAAETDDRALVLVWRR